MGGLVASVAPDTAAARANLQPGDVLVSINGHALRDVIDVRFYAAEETLQLRFRRQGAEVTVNVVRGYDEPLGLDFARPTFDAGVRRCNNRCEFCFVAQMPAGLRPSLYVRDDDYRYSFLFGNYVTLTNLSEADWQRIGEQRLSPLYVSVHATDRDLRRRFLNNAAAPDVTEQLQRLAGMGIEVHTQIVLVPGLNDGVHLDRSIGDLAHLRPAVRSVSVVPVGITRFHRGGCRPYTDVEARAVHDQVAAWQARLVRSTGVRFAYLSDEWYLRLGEDVPTQAAYDGLDLTENGVGLVRRFLDDWAGWQARSAKGETYSGLAFVTGELFAPVLARVAAHLPRVEVVAVANKVMGRTVTVAGLLAAQDVIEQMRGRSLRRGVVLPAAMFGGPEGQSLDELTPEHVSDALGCDVVVASALGDLAPQLP